MYNFYDGKQALFVETIAGSSVYDCCKEAIELANLLDCIIVFIHNDCNMIVRPMENYETVIKRWKCRANSNVR